MKRKNKFSDWREDLIEINGIPEKEAMSDVESEKEITEKKVKNKIVINPEMKEAFAAIGGEVLEVVELDEKDSYKTVAAVIDYDRSKKGSKDATYDSDHGKKKAAKKERDYAAWEREKMKKDDPNWKHKKYHTGMHGEEVEDLGKNKLDEKIDIEKADMGDVVDDFYKSDAPQFKGKSKKKRREMAIAAKLNKEGYQRNPEEGERKEREANKKYERVRGERTPMPPRGNKRREDFEKWYASMREGHMDGAPSIKDVKPAKKTNVKYDPHMRIMAPTIKPVKEETEDSLRDKRMERGGVDGNYRYDKSPLGNKNSEYGKKKRAPGPSAFDVVKAQIRAKHGDGAIIDTKKK